jgi:hypothetical protein
MTRAVVAVLLIALVVVGLGLVLSGRSLDDGAGPGTVVVGTDPPPPPPAPGVGEPAATTTTTATNLSSATVATTRGKVQVRRGGGEWEDVPAGAVLGPDDAVRAGRNAEATLRLGDGVEVRLSPRSELSVRELTEAVSRVRLDEGHVTAVVGMGGRTLRVQARGSDAEAESKGGTFGVVTDGKGTLAVAATTGSVRVSAAGSAVDVNAGEATTVDAGKAPSTPTAMPTSLFLKVGELAATQTNQTATTVSGTTSPGALVRVGDQVATSDAKGRFALKVPLKDGRNDLAVEVVDASGRRQDQNLPAVTVDRVKPPIDAAVQWGRPN